MFYSLAGLIAFVVLLITNSEVLFSRHYQARNPRAVLAYRIFIVALLFFYITDILWGYLDNLPNKTPVFIDTSFFFVGMSLVILTWTIFVTRFIPEDKAFNSVFRLFGYLFAIFGLVLVITNVFTPVLFTYSEDTYLPNPYRYLFLGLQLILFVIIAIYTFVTSIKKRGYKRGQYYTLSIFGLIMSIAISFQLYYPDWPVYTIGLVIGSTLVHTFIVVSGKLEISRQLVESKEREVEQLVELNATKQLAYIDALTGVKSKHAYVEFENQIDELIRERKIDEFSLFIFDLNDLKKINDDFGHETGDKYILESVALIKKYFPNVDIYRYGGDEFIIILQNEAYETRFERLNAFNEEIESNITKLEPVIAVGFADFLVNKDNTLRTVFLRADENMYSRKRKLKDQQENIHISQDSNKAKGASAMQIRFGMYEMFYRSSNVSLIDMLNGSTCDEIVEFDIPNDTFKQFYHVEGKYFVPRVNVSYRDLLDFTYNYIVHPEDKAVYWNLMNPDGFFERLKNSRIPNFDFAHFRYKLQNGSYRWVEQVVICGENYGMPEGMFRMYVFDIHNIKSRQSGNIADVVSMSSVGTDSITGLLTSKDFFVESEKLTKQNSQKQLCLVSLDIEHFKLFDEWFGREKGNILLAKIGVILRDFVQSNGGVAGYFGADDFTLVTEYDLSKLNQLFATIHELIAEFGLLTGFLPAFGVALIEKDMSIVDAFDRASIAATRAKKDIKNRIVTFNADMQFQVEHEYVLLTDFIHALQNDEISFFLQPVVRISNRAIVGAEALARWIKKDGTIIPPGNFVPILEKYGFVTDLDKHIWRSVCKWIKSMLDKGIKLVPISINVSQLDIFNIDIEKLFVDLTDEYQIPRSAIKIEITESAYAEQMSVVDELVKKLRKDGFKVLMDDFGSGYSSLNMLSTLKIDAIKLDAKFLQIKGREQERSIQILESVINIAKTMALPIIVEGAEEKYQIAFLSDLGVNFVQGYYFYKPMSLSDFEKLIVEPDIIDSKGMVETLNQQFKMREFLDKNIYSDSMLNNIIGAVAIYSLKDNQLDIIRYNQQFMDSVNIPDFVDRLEGIEKFMPEEDRDNIFKALHEAKNNKLTGSSSTFRFYRTDGILASFKMHFYYIGKKEGADRFYGSAINNTELYDLKDEQSLVAKYSKDNLIFIRRVDNRWIYNVASHALSDIVGLSPKELEEELNNGKFAKRITSPKELSTFMQEVEASINNPEKRLHFSKIFNITTKDQKKINIEITIDYVGDQTNNIVYILKTKLVD